jgi:ribosome-binding factor A
MASQTRSFARDLRVGDFIRDEISKILSFEIKDPRIGLTSVTDVRVSRDLSYSDIYVSSLSVSSEADQNELLAVLNHAAGFMRSAIAKRHSMRKTPRLRFHYDDLANTGPRLDALIDKALAQDRVGGEDGT